MKNSKAICVANMLNAGCSTICEATQRGELTICMLAAKLEIPVEIIWPFKLFEAGELDALGDRAMHEVFKRCKEHLGAADMVIALLDGALVDDGTAWEIGYFYAVRPVGALIVGVRTDQRRAGEFSNSLVNCMIECSCDRIA